MDKSSCKKDQHADPRISSSHNTRLGNAIVEVVIFIPPEERDIIYKSVSIEAGELPSKRTRVDIIAVNEGLKIVIQAEDVVSLRAALNSFLRFIDSSLKSIRAIFELERSSSID
ncbi:MAG: KEOPS complex subunit Pcc1 [Nitrososphaerota archaeon]